MSNRWSNTQTKTVVKNSPNLFRTRDFVMKRAYTDRKILWKCQIDFNRLKSEVVESEFIFTIRKKKKFEVCSNDVFNFNWYDFFWDENLIRKNLHFTNKPQTEKKLEFKQIGLIFKMSGLLSNLMIKILSLISVFNILILKRNLLAFKIIYLKNMYSSF